MVAAAAAHASQGPRRAPLLARRTLSEVGSNTMRLFNEPERPVVLAPSVDSSRALRVLLFLLSVTAGSVDVIGFLGLGGLFLAHITGNLVILAAHIIADDEAPLAHLISVPVFIVVLAVTRLMSAGLERLHVTSLRPLLLLEFLLLAGLLALSVGGGSWLHLNAANATLAGMLGVSAMAVQNALVQIALKELPSTTVMTTNMTLFVIDLGEVLLGRSGSDGVKARERAKRTGLAIVGFIVGGSLGAWWQAVIGLWSLTLPAGFVLLALAIALAAKPGGSQTQSLVLAPSRISGDRPVEECSLMLDRWPAPMVEGTAKRSAALSALATSACNRPPAIPECTGARANVAQQVIGHSRDDL
jgi:uncharacterized membrane protein YoaK (UPF0700 family)